LEVFFVRITWKARAKRQSGVIPDTEFKRLEDRAVKEAIALQTEAGLDVSIRIIDEGRIVSSISN
jgi:methionine synthase II (cobalamin-independent)